MELAQFCCVLLIGQCLIQASGAIREVDPEETGTIVFATVGRSQYAFDVFSLSLPAEFPQNADHIGKPKEQCLTDGKSVNWNGHLVEGPEKEELLQWLKNQDGDSAENVDFANFEGQDVNLLVHVSERQGHLRIFYSLSKSSEHQNGKILVERPLFSESSPAGPHLQDSPQVGGGRVVFVSTEEDPKSPRQSWTAVYSAEFKRNSPVVRLTPAGVSDYSPSLSPSGKWVAVASLQGKGWQGETAFLMADLYVLDSSDGSERRLVVSNAGWPTWADESTIYFHREAEDGWWSVFKISLPEGWLTSGQGELPKETRVTPLGLHAFTPAASRTGDWIALATRRPGSGSDVRHVEVFDLISKDFIKVTEKVAPNANHYNPSISTSSDKIIYHRCRGYDPLGGEASIIPRLEPIISGVPGLSLIRVDGIFPVFSHDGGLLAYSLNGVEVTKVNGDGKRKIYEGFSFGLSWDYKRKGVLYISAGIPFSSELSTVHVISILDVHDVSSESMPEHKILTKEGTGNNAFPSASPDGKYVVFRSGRTGHKNLYIMDAVDGEEAYLQQLTDGPWTDTMPNWSPTGEWIAFSTNREYPDGSHYGGYLIRPDGTELHKILDDGGRVNHLCFSPDGQRLTFTSDFAAVSAEPISFPNQFQPYGEIYISKIDGSSIRRLTHNGYEDGTPNWGPKFIDPADLSVTRGDPVSCDFADSNFLAKEGNEVKDPTVWCNTMPMPNLLKTSFSTNRPEAAAV